MSKLRRIALLRHGETVGNSKTRFHGNNDVPLSDVGRAQVRAAAHELSKEPIDLVVTSPLQRAWESARLVSSASIRLDQDLREVHFGRWEGMTAEEIQAADPENYVRWQAGGGFDYPAGERRDDFVERVLGGFSRVSASGAGNVLMVTHKGVIKVIAEQLLGRPLDADRPELGELVWLTRRGEGSPWFEGRRGSNPERLGEVA